MPQYDVPVVIQNLRIGGEWLHRPQPYEQSRPLMLTGVKTYEPDYRLEVQDYDLFQVQVVLEGSLTLTLPSRQVSLRPGTGVVYRLGSEYSVAADCESRVLYVSHSGDARPLFQGEATWFDCDQTMDHLSEILRARMSDDPTVNAWLVVSLGESLIAHASALAPCQRRWSQTPTNTEDMIAQARVILGASAHTGRSPRDLLKTIGLSYRHLARLFKQHTGKSPKRYQVEARIGSACRMLESGQFTVGEVAAELHYSSPQYFARQFRQVCGKSPREYLAALTKSRDNAAEDEAE